MIVYAGASTILGAGLTDESQSIPNLLGKHYKCPVTILATNAASNKFLLRNIYDYFQNNTARLLIVTWQSWERTELEHNGSIYQIAASQDIAGLPKELHKQYKEWAISQNDDLLDAQGVTWHNKIHNLHLWLKEKGIPHIFYNEMYPFSSRRCSAEWDSSFIGPYSNELSFYWYLKNAGAEADEWYHFVEDGHALWANFLINYIQEHDLIR